MILIILTILIGHRDLCNVVNDLLRPASRTVLGAERDGLLMMIMMMVIMMIMMILITIMIILTTFLIL